MGSNNDKAEFMEQPNEIPGKGIRSFCSTQSNSKFTCNQKYRVGR